MASRDVFVDTSAFYALLDRSDPNHDAVKHCVSRTIGRGGLLVSSDYIIVETVNLANRRSGHAAGRRVLNLVETSAGIRMEWIGANRFDSAKSLFRRRPDQSFSLTDCTSFVLMEELGLQEALTLDDHFKQAGFAVLPRL